MAEMYPLLNQDFNMYTRLVKVGTGIFGTFQLVYHIADAAYDWDDDHSGEDDYHDAVLDDSEEADESGLEGAVKTSHDDDCDEDEDEYYAWPSEFWSYGNSMALNFFLTHWILSELYRRDKIDALFQVYLKYSHVTAFFTMLTYMYEVYWYNWSASFGVGFFAYGYKKYYLLWRSVDKYVEARNVMRYLDEYEKSSSDEKELDEF
jgi:hypothetical protein